MVLRVFSLIYCLQKKISKLRQKEKDACSYTEWSQIVQDLDVLEVCFLLFFFFFFFSLLFSSLDFFKALIFVIFHWLLLTSFPFFLNLSSSILGKRGLET